MLSSESDLQANALSAAYSKDSDYSLDNVYIFQN